LDFLLYIYYDVLIIFYLSFSIFSILSIESLNFEHSLYKSESEYDEAFKKLSSSLLLLPFDIISPSELPIYTINGLIFFKLN